jgi:hypothetical protein
MRAMHACAAFIQVKGTRRPQPAASTVTPMLMATTEASPDSLEHSPA